MARASTLVHLLAMARSYLMVLYPRKARLLDTVLYILMARICSLVHSLACDSFLVYDALLSIMTRSLHLVL